MTPTMAFRINEARAQGWGDRAEAFVKWQHAMNVIVLNKTSLTIHDFPDWDFASAFEDGESAEDAAQRFIEDQCADMGIDPEEMW